MNKNNYEKKTHSLAKKQGFFFFFFFLNFFLGNVAEVAIICKAV